MTPSLATSTSEGSRPTNEKRPHRSPCSTDSSRKPAPSPTSLRKVETGVSRSASTSRHTGTTVWSRARARKSSLPGFSIGCPGAAEGAEEARALARVARAPSLLLDDEQQGVTVAVVVGAAHPLPVARRLALAPVLLPGAAPEPAPPGREGPPQGLLVHPAEHQHLAGAVLLDDGRNEALAVVGDLGQIGVARLDGCGGGHGPMVGEGAIFASTRVKPRPRLADLAHQRRGGRPGRELEHHPAGVLEGVDPDWVAIERRSRPVVDPPEGLNSDELVRIRQVEMAHAPVDDDLELLHRGR